jgi:predicted dehydrogenase
LATRFINAYANGLPMKPDFSDGFRVQLLSDLLLQSSQKGQPISIN